MMSHGFCVYLPSLVVISLNLTTSCHSYRFHRRWCNLSHTFAFVRQTPSVFLFLILMNMSNSITRHILSRNSSTLECLKGQISYLHYGVLWWQSSITRDSTKSRKSWKPWFSSNVVILPKYRVCRVFGQNAVFLPFYNNILFLISVSLSLLCDFHPKMFYLCLCYQSQVCFLTVMSSKKCVFYLFLELVNAAQWHNFTDENLALHVMMVDDAGYWQL